MRISDWSSDVCSADLGLWRLAGRQWGILENNINQTAASSAASIISGGLVAPIPAWQLITGNSLPYPLLVFWVFVVSALGILVAAGIRNQMLLRERLQFPAGVATAATMRQIHGEGPEAVRGLKLRSEEHTSELQSLMRISYAVFCL